MTATADLLARLQGIFQAVFGRAELTIDATTTAHDVPGWDSFKHIDLMLKVEEIFGITINSEDLDGMDNVGSLVAIVSRKLGHTHQA